MPIMRNLPPREPTRHLDALDEFEGKWVAVKDGEVVEAADTSTELAYLLHRRNVTGAVSRYVPPPSHATRVGLG